MQKNDRACIRGFVIWRKFVTFADEEDVCAKTQAATIKGQTLSEQNKNKQQYEEVYEI
jgi:hypothetical protein